MPVRTAVCFPRERSWHRREVYETGLTALGFRCAREIRHPQPGDVLVTWNRMRDCDPIARQFEAAGATVIVTENGWIGRAPDGGKLYALCLDHHNGAGRWPLGGPERFDQSGIELQPWRTAGEHILVLCQRGFGPLEVAQPRSWPDDVARRLKRLTKRPVRVRPHRGLQNTPLEPEFANCWAAVTWGSGAAIKALTAGIPVFHEMRRWIGAGAARYGVGDLEAPFLGDRLPAFQRLSWGQWSVAELMTGEPFARLLGM